MPVMTTRRLLMLAPAGAAATTRARSPWPRPSRGVADAAKREAGAAGRVCCAACRLRWTTGGGRQTAVRLAIAAFRGSGITP
jgi:hypothetical protein